MRFLNRKKRFNEWTSRPYQPLPFVLGTRCYLIIFHDSLALGTTFFWHWASLSAILSRHFHLMLNHIHSRNNNFLTRVFKVPTGDRTRLLIAQTVLSNKRNSQQILQVKLGGFGRQMRKEIHFVTKGSGRRWSSPIMIAEMLARWHQNPFLVFSFLDLRDQSDVFKVHRFQ